MRFHSASYRNGVEILRGCGAFQEISKVLTSLTVERIGALRQERQVKSDLRAAALKKTSRKAGIQDGLNKELKRLLATDYAWTSGAAVFDPDPDSRKGFWTMDFRKEFAGLPVGLEVTFNHGEALTWTPIRLTLAHEAENARTASRIRCGAIIIGTDDLKGSRRASGGLRMDSAVGTYERLRTVLAKIRSVVTVPIGIFALDWANGGRVDPIEEISLHTSGSGLHR